MVLGAAAVASAAHATPSCTATGMFGHRFGDKPPAVGKRISQSDWVATFSVPADATPPFTERLVRIDRARNEIIEVEILGTLPADEARAWLDAFLRDNPVAPPGTLLRQRGNDPGFSMFLTGYAIGVRIYPGPRPGDPVQLSFSCQRHQPPA
jgi:hypothetical protein